VIAKGEMDMAFNDFLDKVKETSSNAVDKAKDTTKRLATVNDLKSKIRGYNNDKNKLFTQMGMDIYIAKKQGENIDEALDEFVSQIDTINVRIKNLQEKLALLEAEE
jgi:prefoldin subunit 5